MGNSTDVDLPPASDGDTSKPASQGSSPTPSPPPEEAPFVFPPLRAHILVRGCAGTRIRRPAN
jgi:hypothetical protein